MARAERANVLPLSLPPRGLDRCEAAAYIGVSPSLFDMMVKDSRMPPAKRINSRTVWDRRRLDLAFDALPDSAGNEATDDVWNHVAV
jgi:predicted DNA-binding transcriptional regulator AlpA